MNWFAIFRYLWNDFENRLGALSFFVYCVIGCERDRIDESDERDFKELANIHVAFSGQDLNHLAE